MVSKRKPRVPRSTKERSPLAPTRGPSLRKTADTALAEEICEIHMDPGSPEGSFSANWNIIDAIAGGPMPLGSLAVIREGIATATASMRQDELLALTYGLSDLADNEAATLARAEAEYTRASASVREAAQASTVRAHLHALCVGSQVTHVYQQTRYIAPQMSSRGLFLTPGSPRLADRETEQRTHRRPHDFAVNVRLRARAPLPFAEVADMAAYAFLSYGDTPELIQQAVRTYMEAVFANGSSVAFSVDSLTIHRNERGAGFLLILVSCAEPRLRAALAVDCRNTVVEMFASGPASPKEYLLSEIKNLV